MSDLLFAEAAQAQTLAVHVCRSPQIDEAMQLFERLFELHGIPEMILTDNGNPFVAPNSRFGLTRLSAWW